MPPENEIQLLPSFFFFPFYTTELFIYHSIIFYHSNIFCVIEGGVKKAPSRIIEFRSYKRYCKDAFINELDEVNWHLINDIPDIDTAVSAWST